MIVASADSVPAILADIAGVVSVVVSLVEPGASVLDVARISGHCVEHVVVECVDATMPTSDWVRRFGGHPTDLFQRRDAETLSSALHPITRLARGRKLQC